MTAHAIRRWFSPEVLRSSVWRLGLHATSLLLPLLLWLVVSHAQVVDPAFLPSPAQVIESLWSMARSGILMADAAASIRRVMLGFLLAVVVGVPLGILMGSFATIRALLEPLSGFLRYIPAAAFTPLLIIYLGIDE
ncbi:Urea carboxylase-related ABC transporter,permease protein, partial [Candidatus Synechococcus spongiarum]